MLKSSSVHTVVYAKGKLCTVYIHYCVYSVHTVVYAKGELSTYNTGSKNRMRSVQMYIYFLPCYNRLCNIEHESLVTFAPLTELFKPSYKAKPMQKHYNTILLNNNNKTTNTKS